MIDPFGRKITYLRVSVTDRCNLRCSYCMAEDMVFLPKAEILSLEELDRICSAFIGQGVRKLRITGGEPLVRRGVMTLFESLGQHLAEGTLDELTLTTNGTQLAKYARQLAACGVRRVNVSLDTRDPVKFKELTRGGRIGEVMQGLDAATDAGLAVKINTVALRGVNEDEFDDLIAWCGERGFDLTFIETMPMGEIDADRTDHYLPLVQLRPQLARRWTLTDLPDSTGGPARYARIAETGRRIGFITPMSHNFCEGLQPSATNLHGPALHVPGPGRFRRSAGGRIRARESNIPLIAAIEGAVGRKPKGHDFIIDPATKRNPPSIVI